MATRTVNGKSLYIQQIRKKSAPSPRRNDESNPPASAEIQPPPSTSATSSTVETKNNLVARTQVTPSTRIVVVRTTSAAQNEEGEITDANESEPSKSVELPPMLTNGRTSVYLIRRPIPPPEPQRPTQIYHADDFDDTETNQITTTTTTTVDNFQQSNSPTPADEIIISPDPSTPRRTRRSRRRPAFARSRSPTTHSPVNNGSESPQRLLSSPIHSENPPQHNKRRVRSRSKSRTRSSSKRRISPKDQVTSPPPPTTQEEPKGLNRLRSFFSSSQTKNTVVQTNSPLPEQPVTRTTRPLGTRRTRRKKSAKPRMKSAKPVILVNPEDQTIAVIENSYVKGNTVKSSSKPGKRTRIRKDTDGQSTEELVKTSRSHRCLSCLSRHMCLIVVICLILLFVGLAGAGVSIYFLATDSQNNVLPKIIGIAVGGALAFITLCILYSILGCIGSRDGYFSYNDESPRTGGRAFALIHPYHPNAHLYIPRDDMTNIYENTQTSPINSISIIKPVRQSSTSIHRSGIHGSTNTKNVTIEMPERLLTGRKMSPRTHDRKINKIVNNIGQVVDETKKRYHGDIPTKVIIKIDDTTKI